MIFGLKCTSLVSSGSAARHLSKIVVHASSLFMLKISIASKIGDE